MQAGGQPVRQPRLRAIPPTGATGLEPATSGVTGRRSNRLSYAPENCRDREYDADLPPGPSVSLEEPVRPDARSHFGGLRPIDTAVLELDHRQQPLAAQRPYAQPRPLSEAVLDHVVVDALLVERTLNPPARVEIGVQEGPGAAV
jgi:hypothetical protein